MTGLENRSCLSTPRKGEHYLRQSFVLSSETSSWIVLVEDANKWFSYLLVDLMELGMCVSSKVSRVWSVVSTSSHLSTFSKTSPCCLSFGGRGRGLTNGKEQKEGELKSEAGI